MSTTREDSVIHVTLTYAQPFRGLSTQSAPGPGHDAFRIHFGACLSERTLPQIGGKNRIAGRTVDKFIIGSEFDVNGSRRVADGVRTLSDQFERAAVASRAVKLARGGWQADPLRLNDRRLRKLINGLPIRQSSAFALEKLVAVSSRRRPRPSELRHAFGSELRHRPLLHRDGAC